MKARKRPNPAWEASRAKARERSRQWAHGQFFLAAVALTRSGICLGGDSYPNGVSGKALVDAKKFDRLRVAVERVIYLEGCVDHRRQE